ncbi:MAG TPA: GGDEF domain-containing protein [Bryobacteraceae bacterium]|nr:GGDEF domain-containing protein [Bryobacteraceae bacterium]
MTGIDESACDLAILDLLKAAREHAAGTLDRSGFLQACCDRIRERMAVRAAAISLGGVVWSSGLEPAEAARYQPLFERCQPARESSFVAHPVASGCLYLLERVDGGAFDAEAEDALRVLAAGVALVLEFSERADRAEAHAEKLNAQLRVQIEERRGTEEALQGANGKLTEWVFELEQRNRDTALLKEASDLIQACVSTEEANVVIAQYAPRLFPGNSGAVYLLERTGKFVETVASWGETEGWEKVFVPERCWSLRRARPHYLEMDESGLRCTHLAQSFSGWYLCTPLMAHGQPIGLLHVNGSVNRTADDDGVDAQNVKTQYTRLLTETVSEQLAMALANLRLREALRAQAIRDPLTSLFNRRYMEESLRLEIRKAQRMRGSLGCIMVDIDYFKKYNDTWGHAAGDTLLRELAIFLQNQVRTSDIVCRYGGEEFTLILPDASLEVATQRAEQIRGQVSQLRIEGHGDGHASVSLSLGVACYPDHGLETEAVLRAADRGLYEAKRGGRNQVRTVAPRTPPCDQAPGLCTGAPKKVSV